jgi:hypothetical protein
MWEIRIENICIGDKPDPATNLYNLDYFLPMNSLRSPSLFLNEIVFLDYFKHIYFFSLLNNYSLINRTVK